METKLFNPNFKQDQLRSDCTGLCQIRFGISLRIETSGPLQDYIPRSHYLMVKIFFQLPNQNFPCCSFYQLILPFNSMPLRKISISTKLSVSTFSKSDLVIKPDLQRTNVHVTEFKEATVFYQSGASGPSNVNSKAMYRQLYL